MVRLSRDARSLAELEHGLRHGRGVTARTHDDETVVRRRAERIGGELAFDGRREFADILALKRSPGRNGTHIADRVAVALLDLRRHDDDVVRGACNRTVGHARDQPRLALER